MPLITFTGLPSSGKTYWALKLKEGLDGKIEEAKRSQGPGSNYNVIYHSDETLGIPNESYRESSTEKHSRGSQMSAVKRDLSRSNIVILDSLSYIKGFRYQLYCEAKNVLTPHCVIHVVNPLDNCLEWNEKNIAEKRWDSELIKQICMRYEEPNDDNRWDSPLFTLASNVENEELPLDEIWDSLVLKKPPPPNAATLIKPATGTNYLQELDKRTQDVVAKIIQHQQLTNLGGQVIIDKEKNISVDLPPKTVTIAQLQRIRRAYVSLNRMRTVDPTRITPLFVEYLDRSLNND
ncbi:Piso0_005868 [Millerozyma farinosa CBS 7064]|uniref:Piso0_005868 protein n=1 Tax=Pichia sorbitophila (strain ATCC MYA-4447 / BCRC 22081 / CBS 7064 / NBRC 10061 / NRRL Y-12695) TaxID=559304 RepID=G8Y350_PICSO|nr:Piso0_005868 [Millerozyma farinosa CBS 7064]